jgi:hypothetical protein
MDPKPIVPVLFWFDQNYYDDIPDRIYLIDVPPGVPGVIEIQEDDPSYVGLLWIYIRCEDPANPTQEEVWEAMGSDAFGNTADNFPFADDPDLFEGRLPGVRSDGVVVPRREPDISPEDKKWLDDRLGLNIPMEHIEIVDEDEE